MTTGQRIRAARKRAGLTQADLASKLGIPYQSIGQWERDVRNPKYETLQRIADALETPLSGLLSGPEKYLSPQVQTVFIKRFLDVLNTYDSADIEAATGSTHPYDNLIDQDNILLSRAKKIADELGVTLDYLTGLTDEPNVSIRSVKDPQLQDAVDDADVDLLNKVHDLCGMDTDVIAENYATGNLNAAWNPRKIRIVQEYLHDSRAILEKLFAAAGLDVQDP